MGLAAADMALSRAAPADLALSRAAPENLALSRAAPADLASRQPSSRVTRSATVADSSERESEPWNRVWMIILMKRQSTKQELKTRRQELRTRWTFHK
jgi:hypothetical protein